MSKTLSMSQFGKWGRAGNQFFQYAFLKCYAKKYDLELQLPEWVGTHLFGNDDPPITETLPIFKEQGNGTRHPIPPVGDELVGKDFRGYAQYHTSRLASEKEYIRSLFLPDKMIYDERVIDAEVDLERGQATVIGLHIRRGDYGRGIFPLVPIAWYLEWLENHFQTFTNPKLFIATEDPSVVSAFAKYDPQTVDTLGLPLQSKPMQGCTYLDHDLKTKDTRAMDWYPDFHLLSTCSVVLGGSSTFSFFAAMLNPVLKEYWRATLTDAAFVRTDPWDAYPMLREHVKDFPHLDGIKLATNSYW